MIKQDYYELTYIIPLKYAGDSLQSIVDEVTAKVTELGVDIKKNEQFGKLRFSYQIEDQFQGFYYTVEFVGNADIIQTLTNWLNLKREVLRFLLLKKDPNKKDSLTFSKEEAKKIAQTQPVAERVADRTRVGAEVVSTEAVSVDATVMPDMVVESESVVAVDEAVAEVKKESTPVVAKKKTSIRKKKNDDDAGKASLDTLDKKLDAILDSSDSMPSF